MSVMFVNVYIYIMCASASVFLCWSFSIVNARYNLVNKILSPSVFLYKSKKFFLLSSCHNLCRGKIFQKYCCLYSKGFVSISILCSHVKNELVTLGQ